MKITTNQKVYHRHALFLLIALLVVGGSLQAAETAPAVTPAANVVVDKGPTEAPAITPPLASAPEAITSATQLPQPPANAEEPTIYLNFDNASLASVLNYLGEQRKLNVIPHKDLEGIKVTLSTRTPLTISRAWDALITLLNLNGFSMIKVSDIYRIVQSANNGQEPLPYYSSAQGVEPEQLPENETVIRYVYFYKNIKAETARGILAKLIDEKGIIDQKDLNATIIKDTSLNIKSAMKIIKELDQNGLREAISVIKLTWTSSDNVKKMFDDILGSDGQDSKVIRFTSFQQKESSYFAPNTKIISEPIQNNLILLGTPKSIEKIKDFIYKYIDIPMDSAQSRLHIKDLRHLKAQDIKPILDELVKPPRGAGSDKALVLEGGYKIFEDVIISAEQEVDTATATRGSGNRLIVSANHEDWRRLEEFIDKLDKPQPQIALEVLVVDVNIDATKELGTQTYGIMGHEPAHNVSALFNNLTITSANSSQAASTDQAPSPSTEVNVFSSLLTLLGGGGNTGASFVTIGRTKQVDGYDNVWAIIRSVLKWTNSQVITQPYIIANNNQLCNISTKDTRLVEGALSTGQITSIRQKDAIEASVSLDITPYINLAGTIDLNLVIKVNEFTDSQNDQPSRSKREVTTKVSMGTGEVLVIGGLTKSQQTETVNATPILSHIPIIGNLFKSKQKSKTETNLYLFLRPSLIKPRFEGAPDEYTQLKLDYSKYQLMRNDTYVHDRDPVQRWFFKPTNQSIKDKLNDYNNGVLRPIDNFTYARARPRSVNIAEDPYFNGSAGVAKAIKKRQDASAAISQPNNDQQGEVKKELLA
jgi:general secretion pathway protein D